MKYIVIPCLFLSLTAQAAMVLPPRDIQTIQGRNHFAQEILTQMPALPSQRYTLKTITKYVGAMNDLLYGRGLADDEQFKKWAIERPDLKTFRFYSFHEQTKDNYALDPDYANEALRYFEENLVVNYNDKRERFAPILRERILELIEQSTKLQSNAVSAGLSSVFDTERRRTILAQKDILLRTESLRRALKEVNLETLRSRFQSERFAIPREELTLSKAIELLDKSVALEIELIHLVSALDILSRTGVLNSDAFDVETIQWITSEDPAGSDLLEDSRPTVKSAFERLRSIARNSFSAIQSNTTRLIPDTEIIIQEIAPHLAVFRSCAGGDCSTSSSWAYPFSPKERNFFIYDPNNPFEEIGYISGNIVELNGIDTLYIRDMTGRKMSPDHIDLIIKGFPSILSEIGVSQLAFAIPEFHNSENYFRPLSFRIESLTSELPIEPINFTDRRLRVEFLDRVVLSSHYDSPERHQTASLYVPGKINPDSLTVHGQRVSDNFIQDLRTEINSGDGLWRRLELALVANNPMFLEGTDYKFEHWSQVFGLWTNRRRLKLDTYFSKIEIELEKMGLSLTPAIRRKFPDLTYLGAMQSPDIFSHPDPTVRQRNFDLALDRFLRFSDPAIMLALRQNSKELANHRPFQRAIQQILQRFRAADRAKISALWENGYHFEGIPVPHPVIEYLANDFPIGEREQAGAILSLAHRNEFYGSFANQYIYLYALELIGFSNNGHVWTRTPGKTDESVLMNVAAYLATRKIEPNEYHSQLQSSLLLAATQERRIGLRVALTIAYLNVWDGPLAKKTILEFKKTLRQNLENKDVPLEARKLAARGIEKLEQLECEMIASSKGKAG